MFLTSHAFPEIPESDVEGMDAFMHPKAWEECLQRRGLAERPGRVELEAGHLCNGNCVFSANKNVNNVKRSSYT